MINNWKAFHIFYHNVTKHDELISVLANKSREYMENGDIEKWFFLRYWDGGPHIRFRLLQSNNEINEEITTIAKTFILKNPSEQQLMKEEYYDGHLFDGEKINPEELIWHEEGEILNYPYHPENERYGGKEVMENSETIFMLSSDLVDQIQKINNKLVVKLFYATALTYLFYQRFRSSDSLEELKTLLSYNIDFWKVFADEHEPVRITYLEKNEQVIFSILKNIEQSDQIQTYLNSMQLELNEIRAKVDHNYFDSILSSHVHMMNNRFGISPAYERIILIWIYNNIQDLYPKFLRNVTSQ